MKILKSRKFLLTLIGLLLMVVAVITGSVHKECNEHTYGEERLVGKEGSNYLFRSVCTVCGEEKTATYMALLTFVDDDAKADALRHWENIIDATGITMTSAIPVAHIQEKENYEEILLKVLGEKTLQVFRSKTKEKNKII